MTVTVEIWQQKRFEQDLGNQQDLILLVLNQFLLDLEDLGQAILLQLKGTPDISTCCRLAHALKGAASQVRCEALSQMCQALEEGSDNQETLISINTNDFEITLKQTINAITRYLVDKAN